MRWVFMTCREMYMKGFRTGLKIIPQNTLTIGGLTALPLPTSACCGEGDSAGMRAASLWAALGSAPRHIQYQMRMASALREASNILRS